jgi:hypothetical protein
VFGSALPALQLSRKQFNELGVVVRDGSGPLTIDSRTDMIQLGFLTLSVLLRRPINPACYPRELDALLDEFTENAGLVVVAARCAPGSSARSKSARMHSRPRPTALAAAGELPTDLEMQRAESAHALLAFPLEAVQEGAAGTEDAESENAENEHAQSADAQNANRKRPPRSNRHRPLSSAICLRSPRQPSRRSRHDAASLASPL